MPSHASRHSRARPGCVVMSAVSGFCLAIALFCEQNRPLRQPLRGAFVEVARPIAVAASPVARRGRSSFASFDDRKHHLVLDFVGYSPTVGVGTSLVARSAVPASGATALAKVSSAAAQGMNAAVVAAALSAVCEPIVNRLLVKRMSLQAAFSEISLGSIAAFFLTTFPTNMLKFPAFEVINILLSLTPFSGQMRGIITGALFCTLMLPVTNFRFRKSMGWPITVGALYQAYIPTLARDITYGWARGTVGSAVNAALTPESLLEKAVALGFTVFCACILSSPGNEWRGYTLQSANRQLAFFEYFKPANYLRSTTIGATIMGVSLASGMLLTPYMGQAIAWAQAHPVMGVGAFLALWFFSSSGGNGGNGKA